MTRELQKTILFVLVAAALSAAAFVNIPDRTGKDADFRELGTKFFPEFTDPNAATDLDVIDFDADTASVSQFNVMLKDGKWVIPSHYGYPADAKDRLVKTATGLMDLTKDTIRSDRVEDHETLGVVDPKDEKVTTLKGVGKRVTLKDTSGKVLADFIIGKDVHEDRVGAVTPEDSDGTRAKQRYVRIPGQKRTYGVNIRVENDVLSTRFADWIESNMLKLDASKVRKVSFDSHKVDRDRGEIVPGEIVTIERKDAGTPWTLAGGPIPAGKELDTEKLFAMASALGDVKTVGVRPKPRGLSRELVATGDLSQATSPVAVLDLRDRGFFLTPDGRVLSNEGDVVVSTDEGAIYTLRFGGVFVGGGESLSAGTGVAKDKKDAAKPGDRKPGESESRYLMVTIAFDPSRLPPLPDPDAGKPIELPADVFHHEPGSPEWLADEKLAKEKADKRKVEVDKQVADAETKVKGLSDRFAPWYYLTPNESFRTLALGRETLIRDKPAKPPGGGPEGGFPGGGFPGGAFPGMPPGGGRPFNPHGPQ